MPCLAAERVYERSCGFLLINHYSTSGVELVRGGGMKREMLVNGLVYHVFSRSIAGYKIFNDEEEFNRLLDTAAYYQKEKPDIKFSRFIKLKFLKDIEDAQRLKDNLVDIIAYCIMPTHIHFVLRQNKQNGIVLFLANMLNSYTRYFNVKHGRKGPLWDNRFKHVHVESDEYLLHLTRYVHLNPVTSYLVEKPEIWDYSSYKNYIMQPGNKRLVAVFKDIIIIKPDEYKSFVEDRISYQRELHRIKSLMLE